MHMLIAEDIYYRSNVTVVTVDTSYFVTYVYIMEHISVSGKLQYQRHFCTAF